MAFVEGLSTVEVEDAAEYVLAALPPGRVREQLEDLIARCPGSGQDQNLDVHRS
ncbi:hypothetical protein WCD74_01230 [Actinomycetospora sp. OC33-EN08]|uniref:Anti-sigma factor n=1 Tax=Actinomycetospora aurantiaca TaxID=3129233 RepID=A0ABU8MGL6_9PSEU